MPGYYLAERIVLVVVGWRGGDAPVSPDRRVFSATLLVVEGDEAALLLLTFLDFEQLSYFNTPPLSPLPPHNLPSFSFPVLIIVLIQRPCHLGA